MTTQTFREGAKFFLKSHNVTDEDRKNVFHRLKFIAESSGCYKGVQKKDLEEQTRKALAARKEANKFERVVDNGRWPKEMLNIKHNLLQTTKLDEEAETNNGNENTFLPSSEKTYVFHLGFVAKQRISQFKRHKERLTGSAYQRSAQNAYPAPAPVAIDDCQDMQPMDVDESATDLAALSAEELRNNSTNRSGAEKSNNIQSELLAAPSVTGTEVVKNAANEINREEDDSTIGIDLTEPETCPLKKAQVEFHPLGWKDLEIGVMTEQAVYGIALADPYQPNHLGAVPFMDDSAIGQFIQFSKRALVPGGYIFVFAGWSILPQWHKLLQANGMNVCPGPFRVCLDTEQLQKNNSNQYQDPVFVALVARKPGRHPQKFTMDLVTPYLHIPSCRFSRKFGIMDKVPVPPKKLTLKPRKKLLHPTEKSPKLFLETPQTFCREGGRVLDPFAGATTSGMACISSGRPCTLLEADSICVKFAGPRLEMFARSQLESEDIPVDTTNGPVPELCNISPNTSQREDTTVPVRLIVRTPQQSTE